MSALRLFLVSAAFACLATPVAFAQPKDLTIFILAGQSNMSGRGKLPVPKELDGVKEIWNYTNAGRWDVASEPLDDPTGQVDPVSIDEGPGIGPGLAFAVRMRRLSGKSIGLVQCAKGGSSMEMWRTGGGRETLYGSCIARAKEASRHGRIAGILWYQGESDAFSEKAAQDWNANFVKLAEKFRQDLAAPKVPIVYAQLGQLSKERRALAPFAYWDAVKKVQANVSIPNSAMIPADKFELSSDGIHLSTKGFLMIGRKFADVMHPLMQGHKQP